VFLIKTKTNQKNKEKNYQNLEEAVASVASMVVTALVMDFDYKINS
jgi:hypothetical protein